MDPRLDQARHVREADRIGKPVLWGEFGWLDKATRNTVYKEWTDLFDRRGGDGWLYWILVRRAGRRHALPGLRRLHRLLPVAGLHDADQRRRRS